MKLKTKQVQQRFPVETLKSLDEYANDAGVTRTGLINTICELFLNRYNVEIEKLKKENEILRNKIIKIVMDKGGY